MEEDNNSKFDESVSVSFSHD